MLLTCHLAHLSVSVCVCVCVCARASVGLSVGLSGKCTVLDNAVGCYAYGNMFWCM